MNDPLWFLAHESGVSWDEIALFAVPILVVAVLVIGFEVQRRRK